MNFKKATNELLAAVTLEDLAKALQVSVQAVRQARAAEGTTAYRNAPRGWEMATIGLVNRRLKALSALAKALEKQVDS